MSMSNVFSKTKGSPVEYHALGELKYCTRLNQGFKIQYLHPKSSIQIKAAPCRVCCFSGISLDKSILLIFALLLITTITMKILVGITIRCVEVEVASQILAAGSIIYCHFQPVSRWTRWSLLLVYIFRRDVR